MKRLLLIGFPVFNYIDEIIAEAELLGYQVTYYNIEPWTPRHKLIRRINQARFASIRDQEQRDIIERESQTKYDIVLFIQCHQFSLETLDLLRQSQKQARFILYNWDSLTTFDYSAHIGRFDKVSTFDSADAARLGVDYLPLFCIREMQPRGAPASDKRRVYFVGKVEGMRRYGPVRRFREYCQSHDITFDCHMVAARWTIYLELAREGILATDVSRRAVSKAELRQKMEQASAVFDCANYLQTGFTMRVMENLCAGKKLITASQNIIEEPFYSPEQIFVYKDDNFEGVDAFMNIPLPANDHRMDEFFIQSFVRRLLS